MSKVYKPINLFFFLLLTCFTSQAQVLLSESFDGTTFVPTGWTNTVLATGTTPSGATNGGLWRRITVANAASDDVAASTHSGAGMAKYDCYNYKANSSAALVTKSFSLTGGGAYRVGFWFYRSALYTNEDSLNVLINTAANMTGAVKLGTIYRYINYDPVVSSVGWYFYTFNIPSSYTSSTNYIIFQAVGMYGVSMLIDDVVVDAQPTTPPACVSNIFPANNATNVAYDPDVTLKWRASKDVDSYDLHYKVVGAASDEIVADITDTTYTLNGYLDGLLGSTAYTWYIVPKNSIGENTTCATSSATTFTTAAAKSAAPSCVEHVSPANNAINVPLSFTLKWHSDSLATQYAVFIGTSSADADFFEIVTDTTLSLSAPSSYFGTDFYWFIIPFNAVGEPSSDCEASNATIFTFADEPSAVPSSCANRTYPVNGATGVPYPGGVVTLKWDAVPDAVGYKIYFSSTAAGVTGATSASTTTTFTSIDVTGFNSSVTRYWAIVPYNSVGDAVGCLTAYSFTTATTLPVTFGSFSGKRLSSNAIQLAWSTLSEINSKGFYVERSADGISYSSIGFVASVGAGNYTFNDESAFTATSYYRLKQVDNDGKTAYSSVVTINGVKVTNVEVTSIYPNPATSQLSLIIASPESDNLSLVITDITGKQVLTKSLQVISGNNKATIDVSSFAKGTYLIKTLCKNGCISNVKKFVKE